MHHLVAVLIAILVPLTAQAFSVARGGSGCHERLTSAALRTAREQRYLPPLPVKGSVRALLSGLPFQPEGDMADVEGLSMLVGVREPDLTEEGRSETQLVHCMRRADQDEPRGSAAAVDDCRALIREAALKAGRALVNGAPASEPSLRVQVALESGQQAEVALPEFYVEAGRALHTLQDSFAHAYRSEDGLTVRVVLNRVDLASEAFDERRDGPAHSEPLDECDGAAPLQQRRRQLAEKASTALLLAMLEPDGEAREAAVQAVLDAYLQHTPGCTFENGWCDAPERRLPLSQGCSTASGSPLLVAAALALLAQSWGRKRRVR